MFHSIYYFEQVYGSTLYLQLSKHPYSITSVLQENNKIINIKIRFRWTGHVGTTVKTRCEGEMEQDKVQWWDFVNLSVP
jgi:hypothetical protein